MSGCFGPRVVVVVACCTERTGREALCVYNGDSVGEMLNLPGRQKMTALSDRDLCRIDSPKTEIG
jgi:hypothetical protein